MGRGGPPDPDVIDGGMLDLTPQDLLELADSGKHAASDYIEDALLGRVPTVGCRRCGGGLAGEVRSQTWSRASRKMNELDCDLLLFEGSGAAIPPVHSDATGSDRSGLRSLPNTCGFTWVRTNSCLRTS